MAEDLTPSSNGDQQPDIRSLQANLRSLESMSVLLDRLRFANQHGITFDGKRDEYVLFGYPRHIGYKDYREEYERGGIAGAVIDTMPNACWRGDPPFELIEDEDPEKDTAFEQAWKTLDKKHEISSKLQRVDKLASLSTYAVLLLGDGDELDQELRKHASPNPDGLLYVKPYSGGGGPGNNVHNRTLMSDASVTIHEYEEDTRNPRFGLPRSYRLKMPDLKTSDFRSIHWSRIIHAPAEGLLEDEVFGLPALERIYNLLIDLRKVTGGGSEAFWIRANAGLHVNVDKDLVLQTGATPDTSEYAAVLAKLKEDLEAYKHNLTRIIRTRGVDINQLGSDVANFANPSDAIITQIAGARRIPKRILTGSEMGELASSQDRENFKDQVVGRQQQHCAPIVRKLGDRLIDYGYLPSPAKGPREYQVKWPHIQVLTEGEKSDGAVKWSQTKVGEDPVFTDAEIRDKWYGMPPLSDEQRAEIDERKAEAIKRQQEAMAATAKPDEDEDEDEGRFPRAAAAQPGDEELVKVLAKAIEVGNLEVVGEIIGLKP